MALLCGDFVDGRDEPDDLRLYREAVDGLPFPRYETLGNHDLGNRAALDYFIARHGARYYAFDAGGVRFLSLDKPHCIFESVTPMDDTLLAWIEQQVTTFHGPIVTFSHEGGRKTWLTPGSYAAPWPRARLC